MPEVSVKPKSEAMQWRSFTCTLLLAAAMFPALLYLYIVVVDPYDNLPMSPNWIRFQVSGTNRSFKPSLARRPQYDSAVIGSSSTMLLHPGRLGKTFKANLATLAMPAASPYEQIRLLELFHRHHPAPRFILVGLDDFWCEVNSVPKQLGANVGQPMRDWLYDDNQWNNWPPLNSQVLKYTQRQLKALMNPDQDPAAYDGYYNFTVENYGSYDLNRARTKIYGQPKPVPRPQSFKTVNPDSAGRRERLFPDVERLSDSLASLPLETVKMVVLPPYHWYRQFQKGEESLERLADCKRRIGALAERLDNFHVLDFMRLSPITLEDSHYWDGEHYNNKIARSLELMITDAVLHGRTKDDYYHYWRTTKPLKTENNKTPAYPRPR